MSKPNDNWSQRGLLSALTISSGAALLAWIYWLLDFPMFDDEVWLWLGFFGILFTMITAVLLILRVIHREFPEK